jgi:hypothetical protein
MSSACYDGATMTPQPLPELKKPDLFDIKKAEAVVKKLIQENREWVKEMAGK